MTKTLTGTQQHIAVAQHRQASKHSEEKDYAQATHRAHPLGSHPLHAVWHDNEATKTILSTTTRTSSRSDNRRREKGFRGQV
jgi:hypothetical protein